MVAHKINCKNLSFELYCLLVIYGTLTCDNLSKVFELMCASVFWEYISFPSLFEQVKLSLKVVPQLNNLLIFYVHLSI